MICSFIALSDCLFIHDARTSRVIGQLDDQEFHVWPAFMKSLLAGAMAIERSCLCLGGRRPRLGIQVNGDFRAILHCRAGVIRWAL